jgi:Helix-turn-helix domain
MSAAADPRFYTVREVLERLRMGPTTFKRLRAAGKLPFLEELRPRLGRIVRYRADPVDRYLRNEWQVHPRVFGRRQA